jgi:two-component system phosphate regulon sensor histidine kinase PhoR
VSSYWQGFTSENGRMQAILTSMVDGLVAVDKEGRIVKANRAAESLFMLQEPNLWGQTFKSLLNMEALHVTIMEVLKTGVESLAEYSVFPNSENIYCINVVPIKGEKEDIEGALAVFHDITDARKFDRMRSDFVANVSHELRTPLTSIKGFVETLLDGALEDKLLCRRFLSIIDSETNRLTRLIDDLLTLSAMETKEIKVSLQNVNLVESVKNVFNIMGPQAEEKKLRMELIYPPGVAWVKADQDLVDQVLINLIDNAIKYSSDEARIVVRIAREDKKTVIRISDTGIGIAQESLPRLFERFYRVDRARSRVLGGTGLGLAIVKHIVELHGGEVFVNSQVGVGSTFTFCLPTGDLVPKICGE